MIQKFTFSILVALALSACQSSSEKTVSSLNLPHNSTSSDNTTQLPIVLIGPSTVYIISDLDNEHHADNTPCQLIGWGDLLADETLKGADVYNFARAGSSAGSYLKSPQESNENPRLYGPNRDHYWAKAKEQMQKLGHGILLIQFGGNDAHHLERQFPLRDTNGDIIDYNHDGKRDLKSDNDARWQLKYDTFAKNLKFYIDEAKQLNFIPILITSPNARMVQNGSIPNSRGDYPKIMKQLAQKEGIEVLDLHQKTLDEYNKLHTNQQLNQLFPPCYRTNNSRDFIHFEKKGAQQVVKWIKELSCKNPQSRICKEFR